MKKTLSYGALMLSLLSFNSCSSDMDMPENSADNSARLTLSLPAEVVARGFAEGEHANQLSYAVYLHGEDGTAPGTLVASETKKAVSFTNGVYELPIQLVNGKAYDIVFWADNNSSAMYEFDADNHTVTMTDEAFASNMDEVDAFYGVLTTPVIDGAYSDKVELYRPFAQLNLGASDLDNETFQNVQNITDGKVYAKLTVDTYSKFDIFNGTCTGETVTKTYAMPVDAIDSEANPFPYMSDTYKYVAMHYLLMSKSTPEQESDVVNLKYEFFNDKGAAAPFYSIEVPNVPVRQNYRTNLYGQIFTEDGTISVEIKPGITDINWPVNSTVVTTAEELLDAVASAKNGTTLSIPAGTTITLNVTEDGGDLIGDFLEPSSDIEVHVGGTLAFEGASQIVPMEGARLTLSGEGKVKTSSSAFLMRAEDGDIIVNGNLKFEVTGSGGLGFAANGHTLSVDNAQISSRITNTKSSVLALSDGGTISMNNSTVTSNIRICAYLPGFGESGDMLMTAKNCRFITNVTSDFNSYAFVTYPGKPFKYEFIDSHIASNTGCVYISKGGTLIYKGTSIVKAGRMSNFKNSTEYGKIPVMVENGAKGIQFSGYSGVYNEWNEEDETVATVKDFGADACYMMASHYTGPTVSNSTGEAIPGYSGYKWGEVTTIFTRGMILDLNGEIIDKSSVFKFSYSK